ncbi:glucan endo-1 3-alpha-glucosidase agn1 [Fusarium mundagurra]|uniref:Glucan endo-1 3-alpha-glucosidase agn1 n=1 Tax=Fusarium mundagurra TaxID=1567541 RepID=A0A8H5YW22_9HYPO|nr:glucan endo-1 3-alpha-glucosidase agn1 [Fusarium mundagurra]
MYRLVQQELRSSEATKKCPDSKAEREEIHQQFSQASPVAGEFLVYSTVLGKRFCVTEQGRMAIVPPHTRKTDIICVMKGAYMPVENMIMAPFFNLERQGKQNYYPTDFDEYAKNGDKSASSQIPFPVSLNYPVAIPVLACHIERAWQNIDKWWRDLCEAPCGYYSSCSYDS